MITLKDARYVGQYTLEVEFGDGSRATIDLSRYLDLEAFSELKREDRFRDFHVDRQAGAIVWDQVADFYPDAHLSVVTGDREE